MTGPKLPDPMSDCIGVRATSGKPFYHFLGSTRAVVQTVGNFRIVNGWVKILLGHTLTVAGNVHQRAGEHDHDSGAEQRGERDDTVSGAHGHGHDNDDVERVVATGTKFNSIVTVL